MKHGAVRAVPGMPLTGADADRAIVLSDMYLRHFGELRAFIRRTFGGGPPEPEDIVQQTFAQYAAQPDLGRIRNPRAFLYRTARNIAINSKAHDQVIERHRRAAMRQCESIRTSDEITPEVVISERETYRIVEAAIRNLPKRRRELLLLHRLHGLSYAEIARRTGLSESGVKKHVALAVAECGAVLEAVAGNCA